jgi:hypothetical protein
MGLSNVGRHKPLVLVPFLLLLIASACRHTERDLVGDYKLTYTSGREVRIWRPDRYVDHHPSLSVMLAGNVRRYAVRDPYITGYADTQDLDLLAEPDARSGYFLIDTKSDKILAYGMDEKQWRYELQKIGWASPNLKKPHVWF